MLKTYYQNVRGLKTKLSDFRLSLAMSQYDIIVLSETWLDATIADGELCFGGYNVYRCDRDPAATGKSRGGGVLVAVGQDYRCDVLSPSVRLDSCEMLWLAIRVGGAIDLVGAVYIPPASDATVYENFCLSVDDLCNRFPEARVFVYGDFNLPGVSWSNDDLGVSCVGVNVASRVFVDYLSYLNMYQVNLTPNVFGSILDLVVTNCDYLTCDIALNALINCDNYHPALECCCVPISGEILYTDEMTYNFTAANYDDILTGLCNIQWDSLFKDRDIDDCVDVFYLYVENLCSTYVPVRRRRSNTGFPSWFSSNLKALIREKRRTHYLYRSTGDFQHYLAFSSLRSECLAMSRLEYRRHISSLESSLLSGSSPRPFWAHVNGRRREGGGVPGTVRLDNQLCSEGADIANLFSEYFSSVFVAPSGSAQPAIPDVTSFECASITVSISDVCTELLSLDISKGPGRDGLPAVFARNCAFGLSRPLWLIYNKSLENGCFPARWKTAVIKPLHKSGLRSDVRNYRPISILCVFSKVFERLVLRQLQQPIHRQIDLRQHGFMAHRSTTTNLLVYEGYITSWTC